MSKYKIHSWLWLIAGIAITIFSKIISGRDPSNAPAMTLFFYVGLLFIAIGVFKIIIQLVLNKKSQKNTYEKIAKKATNEVNNQDRFRIVYCNNCGSKNYAFFNYCQHCGKKLSN